MINISKLRKWSRKIPLIDEFKYAVYGFYDRLLLWLYRKNEPIVLSKEETLDMILKKKVSITRYGDGEFDVIKGGRAGHFQHASPELQKRLKEILHSDHPNLLVCIPKVYMDQRKAIYSVQKFITIYMALNRKFFYSILKTGKVYGDSFISRPYISFRNKKIDLFFEKMKQIWTYRDVVIIEGEFSCLGVENDLFDNAKSLQRILCPAKEAFNIYDIILNEAQKISKDKLFILALGPTATLLAYDLTIRGYQALDLGHIDIEYEWFKMGVTRKCPVSGKYVSETDGHVTPQKHNDDRKYRSEIITTLPCFSKEKI